MSGPLSALRVVEVAGLGAAPSAAMMLADAGADVVRIAHAHATPGGFVAEPRPDMLSRGRRSIAVDLKSPAGRGVLLLGDFASGGLILAYGITAALFGRAHSGQGQTIDAAMVDGAALRNGPVYRMIAAGQWTGPRGTSVLASGARFMNVFTFAGGGSWRWPRLSRGGTA